MKKESVLLVFFVALFIISVSMLVLANSQITGHATAVGTTSNVTISSFVSIDLSTNLTQGIMFGTLTTTNVANQNASQNYGGTASASTYFVNVSLDSSVNVDICLKANQSLTSAGGDLLGIGNETWTNSSTSNIASPALAGERPMNTTAAETGVNIGKGNSNYYRFWLDVPSGQKAGTYSNNITFEGVGTDVGNNCML